MPNFVLCQSCLRVRPYSDALHQTEGSCVCGSDMCGCPDCDAVAEKLMRRDFTFEAWEFKRTIDFTGYTAESGLCLNKVINHS